MKIREGIEGFSLLELLIVLVLAAILVGLALPSFSSYLALSKLEAASRTLRMTTHLAKSEAIRRGTRVIVCPSGDGISCTRNPVNQVIVFRDRNRNGRPDQAKDILSRHLLEGPTLSTSYNRPYLAFSPLGHASGTNGTYTICDNTYPDFGQLLIISVSGRARRGRDYDNDGIVEKRPGIPVDCSGH